jgi:hypothetical protein
MLMRTTLRIEENLKRSAELMALEKDTTLQAIFNEALTSYLQKKAEKKAKKIVFRSHDLGVPLDNLTREDFYPKP